MLKTDAVVFNGRLNFIKDYEIDDIKPDYALIKPVLLGICNTDEEITKGYMGFRGVLGHEFTGIVEDVNGSGETRAKFIGKRVTGGINLGCNACLNCLSGMERHCKNRQTLGIYNKDGCFSRKFTLPVSNLLLVPDNVSDETAVFIEPLAAAYEILEQVHIKPLDKVLILGDGKLGLCISLIFSSLNIDFILIGKHENKLEAAKKMGANIKHFSEISSFENESFDIVIEATGSTGGFETAVSMVRPRGILVLKSTIAAKEGLNLAKIVVNEITIIGSRCGRFEPVMRLMEKGKIDTAPLISSIVPFEDALYAFELNRKKESIKILLKP
ncbi:MAG: alcohol dehydrogenase catalytic domain-containing protein [Candidatus Gastranaerophilales bacterium]|nr:alcohol dehydrogenase catalytic domain-containing protein [Candidatus Gastranaerophilales bacterium]